MKNDPLTLYKLIVLYMLNRVNFPLTKAQVGDFILGRDYTSFITLQQAISDLTDAQLVSAKSMRNRTHLIITDEGRETLSFFENRISDAIKEDVDAYLKENEIELREEVSIQATYDRQAGGEYVAELVAKEKGQELLRIRIAVPLEEMAASVCDNWQKKNQAVYKYLTDELF